MTQISRRVSRALFCALLFCLTAPVVAAPRWAAEPDRLDGTSHVFTCQGEGKSEDDALAAALGICNDKICKVCGVEVESVVETKETLTGVDLQRKVIERCHRVRRADTQPRFKSNECGPDGCQSWIQVLYTKADEEAECPRYQKENFADPAACEADIQAFRKLEGRDAASFHKRTALLDAALVHCDKIDVRPTPAILALNEKLLAGLDQFEFTDKHKQKLADETEWMVRGDDHGFGRTAREEAVDEFRPLWAWYLTSDPAMRQEFAESKQLTDRIKLVRDLVANKERVVTVLEAGLADDRDSEAGVARILAAFKAAPLGGQYGAPDVHFAILDPLSRLHTSTQAIQSWLRAAYPPGAIVGNDDHVKEIGHLFTADGRISPDEWNWAVGTTRAGGCIYCTRMLIAVRDHGTPEARVAHFIEAQAAIAETMHKGVAPGPKEFLYAFKQLQPRGDPGFVIALESRLPESARPRYDWPFLLEMIHAMSDTQADADQATLLKRAVDEAAKSPASGEDESSCEAFEGQVKALEEARAPALGLNERICRCLVGPQAKLDRSRKSELLERALSQRLSCVRAAGDESAAKQSPWRSVPLAFAKPPAATSAGESNCGMHELKPPRLVQDGSVLWLTWPLEADDFICTRKTKTLLSLSIEAAGANGVFHEYKKETLQSSQVREGVWASDVCHREALRDTTQVRLTLTAPGALAPLSWTSAPIPFSCPCERTGRLSLTLRAAGDEIVLESKPDAELSACLAKQSGASIEARLHAGKTAEEAWTALAPIAVLRGIEAGGPRRLTLSRNKLCAQGVRSLNADLWSVGELKELSGTRAADLNFECGVKK